jgi:hypothetical protein
VWDSEGNGKTRRGYLNCPPIGHSGISKALSPHELALALECDVGRDIQYCNCTDSYTLSDQVDQLNEEQCKYYYKLDTAAPA